MSSLGAGGCTPVVQVFTVFYIKLWWVWSDVAVYTTITDNEGLVLYQVFLLNSCYWKNAFDAAILGGLKPI